MSRVLLIAGPCAIETEKQALEVAMVMKKNNVDYYRGGLFKPRSSPYRWQGLGKEGIPILAEVKRLGLKVVTEAMNPQQIDLLYPIVDMFQIGSRNMQCSELLKVFGKQDKPVLLKRGMAATIEELVMAADFIMSEGNENVILCERGIRSFDPYVRNTFDIACIPAVKRLSDLPIVADPSHGTGRSDLVLPVALAAIAAGADGVMIEVHNKPEVALTDGEQSLNLDEFEYAVEKMKALAISLGKDFADGLSGIDTVL